MNYYKKLETLVHDLNDILINEMWVNGNTNKRKRQLEVKFQLPPSSLWRYRKDYYVIREGLMIKRNQPTLMYPLYDMSNGKMIKLAFIYLNEKGEPRVEHSTCSGNTGVAVLGPMGVANSFSLGDRINIAFDRKDAIQIAEEESEIVHLYDRTPEQSLFSTFINGNNTPVANDIRFWCRVRSSHDKVVFVDSINNLFTDYPCNIDIGFYEDNIKEIEWVGVTGYRRPMAA